MAISKQKMTFLGIIQGLIRARINFGRMLKGNNSKMNKNGRKRRMSMPVSKRRNKMIQTRNGMEDIRKKKKIFIKKTSKETCLVGARTIINTQKVHRIQTIRNIMILTRCSIELSSTAKGYFQRKRKTMVSTHPNQIPTFINKIVVQTLDLIYLVTNIFHGIICLHITLLKLEITKTLIKLKDKTLCSNQLKLGLILRQPKV